MGTVTNLLTLVEYQAAEETAKQKTPPRNVAALKKSVTIPTRKYHGCGQSSLGPFNKKRSSECKVFGEKMRKM